MTYAEAMKIRLRQVQRQPVDAAQAAEAIRVIQSTRASTPPSREEIATARQVQGTTVRHLPPVERAPVSASIFPHRTGRPHGGWDIPVTRALPTAALVLIAAPDAVPGERSVLKAVLAIDFYRGRPA
jgi:hypothetical protein